MIQIDVTNEVNNKFRALLCIAPKKDVRHYLNGVLIEARAGKLRAVATNGHMLAVTALCETAAPDGDYILPRELVERMVKTQDFYTLTISAASATASHGYSGAVIDDKFPNWRRATRWPDAEPTPASFDPEYIGAISKAVKIMGKRSGFFILAQFGDNGAPFQIAPDFFGVLMPLRSKAVIDRSAYKEVTK